MQNKINNIDEIINKTKEKITIIDQNINDMKKQIQKINTQGTALETEKIKLIGALEAYESLLHTKETKKDNG